MSIAAIIPARMASRRFYGKPLKLILGLPMVEHVRRRVCLCDFLEDVIVATCDEEIFDEVTRFGGKALMTSAKHESCVDRVAEAAQTSKAEIIVNVQGDMPFVWPESLKALVEPFDLDRSVRCTDMIGPIHERSEADNPNVVKTVVDRQGNALYYSRAPIPSSKAAASACPISRNKQFGINAFRKDFLLAFTRMPRTALEETESVDMLRLVENGYPVRLVSSSLPVIGVDTLRDLENANEMMRKDPLWPRYRN